MLRSAFLTLLIALPAHSIVIDGNAADWGETEPADFGLYHASMITNGEFAWSDPLSDERTDFASPDARVDLRELRIRADTDYLYFLARFRDITAVAGDGVTQVHVAVDTDRVNASGTPDFPRSLDLQTDDDAEWEFAIFTRFGSGGATVGVVNQTGALVGSPEDSQSISAANDVVEFRVRHTSFLRWPSTLRFTVCVSRSDASDTVSNLSGVPDALDGLTDFGGVQNQASWNEFQDGICQFHIDLRFETGGVMRTHASSFRVNPYLQDVTKSSIRVCFELDAPDSATIEFGTTPALGSSVTDMDAKTFHHVLISGLSTNETYYYKATAGGAVSAVTTFRTQVHDTASFTFASISDPQLGSPSHDAVLNRVRDNNPGTILICGGDLTGDGRYSSNWDNAFFSGAMEDVLDNVPIYSIYGNHEQSGSGATYDTAATSFFNNYFVLPQGTPLPNGNEFWWSKDYGCIHFVGLNLNTDFSPGSAQYAWLENDLRSHDTQTWRIVILHQDPYSSGYHAPEQIPTDVKTHLVPLFQTYDVRWLITGHEHSYERSRYGNLNDIRAAGASQEKAINVYSNPYQQYAEATYCYALWDVNVPNRTLTVRAYREDGSLIESFTDTATSYGGAPTRTADGSLAEWPAGDRMEEESNDTFWIGFDDTYVYIGYQSRNWDDASGGSGDGFIYFDTNPGSGAGASVSLDWNGTHNFGPRFRPGAVFAIEDADYTNGRTWSGAAWTASAWTPFATYIGNSSRDVTEIIVEKARLGLSPGDSLAVAAWAQWENAKNIFASFPDENASSGAGVTETIENYYFFSSVDSGAVVPHSRVIDHFSVAAPASSARNVPFNVRVVAFNDAGETVTSYHSTQYSFSVSPGSDSHAPDTFVAGVNDDSVALDAGGAVTLTFTDVPSGKTAGVPVTVSSPLVFDGSLGEWPSTTFMGTESGDSFYCSFDGQYLYFAWDDRNWDDADGGWGDGFFYIDTNPFSGSGAPTSVDWNGPHAFIGAFRPEIAYIVDKSSNKDGRVWNGSGWTVGAFSADTAYIGWSGTPRTEIAIHRSKLGLQPGESFAVLAWVKQEATKAVFGSFPLQNPSRDVADTESFHSCFFFPRFDTTVSPRAAVMESWIIRAPSAADEEETFSVSFVAVNGSGETVSGYASPSYTLRLSSGTLRITGAEDDFAAGVMAESVSVSGRGLLSLTIRDTESAIEETVVIAVGFCTAAIAAPPDNHDTSVSPLRVSGSCGGTRAGDTVQVYVNSVLRDTAWVTAADTWAAANVALAGGGETIHARVTNRFDTSALSDSIRVNYSNAPVVLAITSPATYSDTTSATLTIRGTASNMAVGDPLRLHVNSYLDTYEHVGTILADSTWQFTGIDLTGVGDTFFVTGTNRYGVTGVSDSVVVNYYRTTRLAIDDTKSRLIAGETDAIRIRAMDDSGHVNLYDTRVVHFHNHTSDSLRVVPETIALVAGVAWVAISDSLPGTWSLTATDSSGVTAPAVFSYTVVPCTRVLVTEISFREDSRGVLGHDWIELKVTDDGRGGAGSVFAGWRIHISAGATKVLDAIMAGTGDWILLHASAGVDETDSTSGNADGVIDLYLGASADLLDTDNTVTVYRADGDTSDFVAWTSVSSPPVTAGESSALARAITTGQWTDAVPAGVGVEDGVNSDSAPSNASLSRNAALADANARTDWSVDTTPTPAAGNDSVSYWRLTGRVDLEGRADDRGCLVSAGNGSETVTAMTDSTGSFTFRLRAGTYLLTADTAHVLPVRRTVAVGDSSTEINLGILAAGDADGDNRVNIIDASITRHGWTSGTNPPVADHVDPAGTVDRADLEAVRNRFGRSE